MATATKTTGSQFDGLLAPRKRNMAEPAEPRPVGTNDTATKSRPVATNDAPPKSRPSAAKSEDERITKTKDDAFKGRTFYVRKKTYAECDYILKTTEDSRDMSDLAEELLSAWLAKEAKRSTR